MSAEPRLRFAASERAALAGVRHVVTTSPSTRRGSWSPTMRWRPRRSRWRCRGSTAVDASPRPRRDAVTLLAVGAVVPRKGYDVLIDALATLADLDWRLVIAGDRTRDRATADAITTRIAAAAPGPRVSMPGAVGDGELAQLHAEADVFVLASRHEGYGMAFAEAINHGLPMVGTHAGADPGDGAGGRGHPGAA